MAVVASYVVSEMIAKAGKPFTEGQVLKDCVLQIANIVCQEKRSQFSNTSLLANTLAQWIIELSNEIYDQFLDKAKNFSLYTVTLD